MLRVVLIFSLIHTIICVVPKHDLADVMEKMEKRMMGLDTVHNVKIDKDTIITRNMKLEQKGRKKYGINKKEETAPDWSYSAFPKEVGAHVQQFKRNMTECLKEVQAKDSRPVKRLSPKTESPVHAECLIACVLKRNGVIQKGGKINKGNLIALVSKFYAKDTKVMKKLEKNLDRCILNSIYHSDECAVASRLNDCTNEIMASQKHDPLVVNY